MRQRCVWINTHITAVAEILSLVVRHVIRMMNLTHYQEGDALMVICFFGFSILNSFFEIRLDLLELIESKTLKRPITKIIAYAGQLHGI